MRPLQTRPRLEITWRMPCRPIQRHAMFTSGCSLLGPDILTVCVPQFLRPVCSVTAGTRRLPSPFWQTSPTVYCVQGLQGRWLRISCVHAHVISLSCLLFIYKMLDTCNVMARLISYRPMAWNIEQLNCQNKTFWINSLQHCAFLFTKCILFACCVLHFGYGQSLFLPS